MENMESGVGTETEIWKKSSDAHIYIAQKAPLVALCATPHVCALYYTANTLTKQLKVM